MYKQVCQLASSPVVHNALRWDGDFSHVGMREQEENVSGISKQICSDIAGDSDHQCRVLWNMD